MRVVRCRRGEGAEGGVGGEGSSSVHFGRQHVSARVCSWWRLGIRCAGDAWMRALGLNWVDVGFGVVSQR